MKKVFDWMREQMREARFPITDCKVGVKVNGIQVTDDAVLFDRVNEIINEAEAKWEADCCEWEDVYKNLIKSPHESPLVMYKVSLSQFPYCPVCGKPIKISEVE